MPPRDRREWRGRFESSTPCLDRRTGWTASSRSASSAKGSTARVTALLLNKLWAYPWMIGVLLGFISYELYRIALDHSVAITVLAAFDVLIVVLTWREYVKQRHPAVTSEAADSLNS
jgi:Predicted membrane protein (DUF2127)